MTQVFRRYLSYAYNVCVAYTPLQEAFVTFQITQPSRIEIIGHICFRHRGNLPSDHYKEWGDRDESGNYINGSGPVGIGCRGALRGPGADAAAVNVFTTVNAQGSVNPPPTWMKGAKVADNLMSTTRHYQILPLLWSADISVAGWYRWELWGAMHGSRYALGSPNYPNPYILPNDFSAVEVSRTGLDTDGPDGDPYNSRLIRIETA